uniref:Uncharacterized protein n=2 Tax=Oryza nivara TaxID=4536 RepID=A0A0E0IM40_ORYNI
MGKMLDPKRLMSARQERHRRRRRRQLRPRNSEGAKRTRYSVPSLPEEIWCHIHSLMSFKDAARAACVSRAFRHSWRCHPNLICCIGILGSDFINKFDRIMKNHSGIGIKSVKFQYNSFYNTRRSTSISHHFDSWHQIAITPWIEELTISLSLSSFNMEYSFPCSLLADGRASSMRHLYLGNCGFHPTINLDLRNLTRLHLINVHITGDELGCLLSNSHCLEQLELMYCNGIICLKIPSLLQCLSHLEVFDCRILQVVENKAPNLCSFDFGGRQVQLLLGESLRMKRLSLHYPDAMYYAHAKLPSNAPNLETLALECSTDKMVDTPILPSKFFHLKCLTIDHTIISSSPAYNYLYLVYFLDACPSLETFLLGISQNHMEHDSIIGDSSHMRQMPGHRHDNLRSVEITGFYSAKSLIELTCYILDNTVALKYLTLDTTRGFFSCSTGEHDRCFPMDKIMITEANRAVLAIQNIHRAKSSFHGQAKCCEALQPLPCC